MMISLMFLTAVLARAIMSNTVKAMTAVVVLVFPRGRRAKLASESGARKRRPLCQRTRFSHPKRRHPHQVLRLVDLDVGTEYVSVHVRECDGRMFEYRRTFAGAFLCKPEKSELPSKTGEQHLNMRFTIHIDGWTPWDFTLDGPSCILWGGDGRPNSYSSVGYLLGGDDTPDQHQLLVPTDRWRGDPHVAVDWGEERPEGEAGEMVWMYDTLDREQRAGVIGGHAHGATRGAGVLRDVHPRQGNRRRRLLQPP